MNKAAVHDGGCLCGAIRYRASGSGSPPALCHCHSCRNASGAPVVAWVTFPEESVSLLRGTPARWHSSPGITREFCSRCGTPLSYRHADYPDSVDLTVCSFDRPEDFPPADNIWLEQRIAWMADSDRLPGHPRTRRG